MKLIFERPESFCSQKMERQEEMRKREQLIDFSITTNNFEFKCHRLVLGSVSDYFYALFSSTLDENENACVDLSHISKEILNGIITYMYVGKFDIDDCQLMELLKASHYLQIEELTSMCVEKVPAILSCRNVLDWLQLSQKLEQDGMQAHCVQFMIDNYQDILGEQSFLAFSMVGVVDFFSHLGGSTVHHDAMLNAALGWVSHDATGRGKHLEELLGEVCVDSCSPPALFEAMLKYAAVIGPNLNVFTVITKGLQKQTQAMARRAEVNMMLVIIGGAIYGKGVHRDCYKMNDNNQFVQHKTITADDFKENYSACVADDGIVLTGGNGSDLCLRFTPATQSWSSMRKMLRKRGYHASVYIQGKLYVAGGIASGTCTDSVDCLVLRENKWEAGPRLPKPVLFPKAAAMDDRMYVLDSKTGRLYELDVAGQVWRELAQMPPCDRFVSMAPVQGRLAVMGGSNRICALYEPCTNAWTEGEQPRLRHLNGSLVYHNDKLLLLGGQWVYGGTDVIEEYNMEDGTWSDSLLNMPVQGLSGHHALVLDVPHNG